MSYPAVFLDRDGTMMTDTGYVSEPGDVHLIPGVPEALLLLERFGYRRIVITNQSGIGRGIFTLQDYEAVQTEVLRQLADAGTDVDAFFLCPHLPEEDCPCRKPKTELHRTSGLLFQVDLARSWCVGDRPSDLLPAQELGGRAILVRTGIGHRYVKDVGSAGILVANDLLHAAQMIVAADSMAQPI